MTWTFSDIHEIFRNHNGRQFIKRHHYLDVYSKFFTPYVDKEIVFLELGVLHGGSLQIWKKFFGPKAVIVGIDIRDKYQDFIEDNIHIRIGDQADKDFLQNVIDEFKPTIILDDASHKMYETITSYEVLFPHVELYVIEDTRTSYWKGYGGGIHKKDTVIAYFKNKIDQLNTQTTDMWGIHFYQGMVVVEKTKGDINYDLITKQNNPSV